MGGLRLTAAVAVAAMLLAVAGCSDLNAPPTVEERMRSMGLPLDILVTIDERTQVTVRVAGGVPELLVFTPNPLGGSNLGIVPATRPTVRGGMVGDTGPGNPYLFGAGQGPVARVETDEPEARVELVNPDIDGWLIVVPETVALGGAEYLPWRLIGPDGIVLYASAGAGMPEFGLAIDDQTKVFVRIRDGVPQLLVYTPNAFGGADLAVTPADTPTVNGGLAGTATSAGHRYLFGAGQGPLRSQQGVQALPSAQDELVNAADWGWVIVNRDSVAIEDVHWSLVDPDGSTVYEAQGLAPTTP